MTSVDIGVMAPGVFRPERVHEEPSRRLFAAWQNSAVDQRNAAADRRLQRQFLRTIIGNAVAAETDEQRRDDIGKYGVITEYLWFGNDHTPLPRGLKRYLLPGEDSPNLCLDPEELRREEYKNITAALIPHGLDELVAYRENLFAEQAGHLLEPFVHAIVTNTPAYRLLESFNITQQTWRERPLTAVERMIEERLAEEAIRQRHQIPANEPVHFHAQAQRDLTRMEHRIDEMTRFDRQTKQDPQSPAQRAHNFFYELAVNELGVGVRGSEIHSIRTVDGQSVEITSDSARDLHAGESFSVFAEARGYVGVPTMEKLRSITSFMMSDAALRLFQDGYEQMNYTQFLEELSAAYTHSLLEELGRFAVNEENHYNFAMLATLLTAPTEIDHVLDGFYVEVTPKNFFNSANLISRKEYRESDKETKGHIKKKPFDDVSERLIQYHHKESVAVPSELEGDADLIIHMPELMDMLVPSIHGYEFTGYNPDRKLYGFKFTPESDPYTECHVALPDAARTALAHEYANLGLSELAMLVNGTPGLTVSQLARDISRTNRYALPDTSETVSLPKTLSGYADQVEDGRLGMQCVGSSHFLKLSLQQAFGPDCSGVISGDVLPHSGRRIPGVRHQQTTFTDPETNQFYILDATSGGANITLWRDVLSGYMDKLRRMIGINMLQTTIRDRVAPPAPEKTPLAGETKAMTLNREELRRSLLEKNKEALILNLRMIFGKEGRPVPQDEMFEVVARLRSDDIIFRTLSTVLLSTTEQADLEEPGQLLRYISSLRECNDRDLLRKVDPREYTSQPRLLLALDVALNELVHINQ